MPEPTMLTLADLKPAPYNPRKISPEALAGLKASLVTFGDLSGLTWNRRSGHLVAGHQRFKALRTLHGDRLELVESAGAVTLHTPDGQAFPVRVVDWDEPTEKAANIAANNPHIAGDFDETIDKLLAEVNEWNPELFDELRLGELGDDTPVSKYDADPDDAPAELPEPTAKAGDLWALGEHRLLCGDSLDPAAVERLMGGERAAMAFTDPPYNVDYEGAAGKIQNDNLGSDFAKFLRGAMFNLLAHTDGACYACMSSSELDTLQSAWRDAGGHWSTFLIWAKGSFTIGRSDYQRQYEPILYGWRKGARHHWCGDRDQGDVWQCDKPISSKLHPTTKPVDLIVRAIRNTSQHGDVVLDLFGGSGSTLIACESAERRARLMEMDPRFCDVIVARWEKFTGRKAVLLT